MVGLPDSVGEVKDVLDAGGLGVEVTFERNSDLVERTLRHVKPSWILHSLQNLPDNEK